MQSNLRHSLLAGLVLCVPAALTYAAEPIVVIETNMSEAEQELLRSVLGDVDAPARSLAQARRRVEAAAKSARSVMRSLGYYDADIRADVIESKAEARTVSEDIEETVRRPPQAVLYVKTGERYRYGDLKIDFKDGLPVDAVVLSDELKLASGEAAEAARVVSTELRLVNV